jgi:7,8-dihydropterin-6-yl-methyl-4-(beta-D-ribofuranosyl)aminobenzene 5'-phosphate synthase
MTVLYDNNSYKEKLEPDWGFSCLVAGLEKFILFDTGTNGQILLSNMEKLKIKPEDIEVVLLSHAHKDHTGGLEDFLARNHKIEVWLPHFFASDFKDGVRKKEAKVIEVNTSQKICEGAYSSGVIDGWIKEQSLVLDTEKGLILMTGCAHPRITNIIARVKELFKKDIYLALGGFHLVGFERAEIKEIIGKFRDFGVQKVGPCHCSGDEARMLFHQEYKDDFIEIGVGKEIEIR